MFFDNYAVNASPGRPSTLILPGMADYYGGPGPGDKGRWRVLQSVQKFDADIDEYRRRYGKVRGELKFLEKHQAYEVVYSPDNMLLVGGVATMWQQVVGSGSSTTGNALCYFNNANAQVGIGDSSTAETFQQYDLQAATNKYYQGMDSTYPLTTDVVLTAQSTVKAVTGATNASPIVITSTAHGFATGDVVYLWGVGGNTNANNLYQITVVDANSFQLNGSTGNAAYTSGGSVSKSNVITFKATVGTSNANYAWNEWVIKNGTNANSRCLNRKVSSLGTKSTGTWAFTGALAVA